MTPHPDIERSSPRVRGEGAAKRRMRGVAIALLLLATAARADFHPRAINIFLSSGKSAETLHGSATMHAIHFELAGRADWMRLRDTDVGVALAYSEVRQPRFLFPPTGGGPKD